MLPFDDRLPTDSTNGELVFREWTPLPPSQCYPRPALDPTEKRGDPTMRRCPPPVAANQTLTDHQAITDEEERLLIMSGASFPAPDLNSPDRPADEEDGEAPILIKSGATFPAPDLSEEEPGLHAVKLREDKSPILIKSGAAYPAPDLDTADEDTTPDPAPAPAGPPFEASWPVRWSLRGVVVLTPVLVIAGLVLTTVPPIHEEAPAPGITRPVATHGSLVPVVDQPVDPSVESIVPFPPLPQSVPPAPTPAPTPEVDRTRRSRRALARRKAGRRVRRLLTGARRSVRQRRWLRARSRAVAALRIMPRHRRARAIRRLSERKLRKHRRHLAGARRAMKRGQWSRARAHAIAALRVNPRDRRARRIKRIAERRLRRRIRG